MTQLRAPMNSISPLSILAAALISLPLLTSTGCLKGDLLLDITKDGSGSIEVNYSISENAISQLDALSKLSIQLDTVSGRQPAVLLKDPDMMLFLRPEEDKIRKRLAVYQKNGITIDRLRVNSNNSIRNVDLRLKFLNITDVARADFFPDAGFSLYKNDKGNYIFLRKSMSESGRGKTTLLNPDMQKLAAPVTEGFSVSIKVHTPGRVLESNAHDKGVASATWTFDQERDPAAFQKLQNQEFAILIEGKDVRIPDIKIVKTRPASKQ